MFVCILHADAFMRHVALYRKHAMSADAILQQTYNRVLRITTIKPRYYSVLSNEEGASTASKNHTFRVALAPGHIRSRCSRKVRGTPAL